MIEAALIIAWAILWSKDKTWAAICVVLCIFAVTK